MDDLDDLLAGGHGFGDRLAGGLRLHGGHEVAGDGEGDVGLKEGHADLAERGLHVLLGERALAREAVEHAAEAAGQGLEHGPSPSPGAPRR